MSSKKGKKIKGKTVSLQEFHGNAHPIAGGAAVVVAPKSNWAEESEDYDEDRFVPSERIVLPTAPRQSRGPSYNPERVPREPPFIAYVANLPFDVEDEDIERFFKDCKITNIRMQKDGDRGGRFKGFGYVEFEARSDLLEALSRSDETMRNRQIHVDLAEEDQSRRGGGYRRRDQNRDRDDEREDRSGDVTDWRAAPRDSKPPEHYERSPGLRRSGPMRDRDDYGGDRGGRGRYDDRGSRERYDDRGGRDRFSDRSGSDRYDDRGGRDRYDDRGGRDRYDDRGGRDRYDDRGGRDRYDDRSGGDRGSRDRYEGRSGRDRYDRRDRYDDRGGRGYDDRGGRERYDDRGGRDRYDDRGGGSGRYGDGRGDNRGGRYDDDRGGGYSRGDREDDKWKRDGGSDAPKERPKLNLKPRSKPQEGEEDSLPSANQSIFGAAKPVNTQKREEEIENKLKKEPPAPVPVKKDPVDVFGQAKPVDTAAREREIEEKLKKQGTGKDAPPKQEESKKERTPLRLEKKSVPKQVSEKNQENINNTSKKQKEKKPKAHENGEENIKNSKSKKEEEPVIVDTRNKFSELGLDEDEI